MHITLNPNGSLVTNFFNNLNIPFTPSLVKGKKIKIPAIPIKDKAVRFKEIDFLNGIEGLRIISSQEEAQVISFLKENVKDVEKELPINSEDILDIE